MKTFLRFFTLFSLALILAVTAVGIAPATPARADAIVVNSLNDVNDGTCDGTHCSLREAINKANGTLADDVITFSVIGTINLTSILPTVVNSGALTISGADSIIISGDTDNNTVGDVQILQVDLSATVTLQNLTLTRGKDTTSGGGAIMNWGTLTVENSVISNNVTTNAGQGGGAIIMGGGGATLNINNSVLMGNSATYYGGAIANLGGTLNITDGYISNNSSANYGGGLYNQGPLTISGSTFLGNESVGGFAGGAIYYSMVGGTATIDGSTFFDNQAESGGAIFISAGTINVSDTTFESNDATFDGGAFYVAGSGVLTLTNSTIAANTSAYRAGGIFTFGNLTTTNVTISDNTASNVNSGGGIYNFAVWLTKNTIVANSGVGGDCVLDGSGSVNSTSSNNLIEGTINNCGLTNGTKGNVVGSDPLLGPLQNNGGATNTYNLLANSPAFNAGTNTGCPSTDQIGTTRPQGGTCDIGAVEMEIVSATATSLNTKDGWILESSETSNAGGSVNSTNTTFYLGDGTADKQYRAVLHFSLGLPAGAVITKATLKIKKQGVSGTDPFTILGGLRVDLHKPFFGAGNVLAVDDFNFAAGSANVSTFSATPVSNWYSAVINATGRAYINKNGVTQIRLRFATDDNDDGAADYMRFFSGDNTNAATWPQLIVEYYLP